MDDKLLFGVFIAVGILIIIWCMMHNSKYDRQKDQYTYMNEYTGTSPNYNSSPTSYKAFNAAEPGDTAFPFGERCKSCTVCPHNARDRGVALCNQGKIL